MNGSAPGCAVSAVTQVANDDGTRRIPREREPGSGQLPQGEDLFAPPEWAGQVMKD